jgi:hypothetical protein
MLKLGKVIVPDIDVVTLRLEEFCISRMEWLEHFEVSLSLERKPFANGAFCEAFLAKSIAGVHKGKYVLKKSYLLNMGGHTIDCSRLFLIFMTLSFVITYSTGIIDQGIDRWTRHEDQITLLCQDWNSKCYFQVICLEGVIPKWRFILTGYSREKMSNAVAPYYNNSTASFRQVIKLIHDVETNPGPDSYSVNQQNNSTDLKIAHLNARSLKNRHHHLLIKEMILSNKFDVFTVSETWLDSKITDLETEIPGYNIYRVDRENKTGGSVCIYVCQIYKTICLRDISSISASGFHQLWLKVQVRHLKSIIICTVYRPPNTPTSCFDSDLAANFVYASSLDAPILQQILFMLHL